MAGLFGVGLQAKPDVYVFRPDSFQQDVNFAIGRVDAGLLNDIAGAQLSDEERSQLMGDLYNQPKNVNVSEASYRQVVARVRDRLAAFRKPREEQASAVQDIQKQFADRPGLSQVRKSILSEGGRIIPGANGTSIVTGGISV